MEYRLYLISSPDGEYQRNRRHIRIYRLLYKHTGTNNFNSNNETPTLTRHDSCSSASPNWQNNSYCTPFSGGSSSNNLYHSTLATPTTYTSRFGRVVKKPVHLEYT